MTMQFARGGAVDTSHTDCELLSTTHPFVCPSFRGSLTSLFVTYSRWKSSRFIFSLCFQAFSSLRHSKRATMSLSSYTRCKYFQRCAIRLYPGLWQFVSKFQLINGTKKEGRKHSREREKKRNRIERRMAQWGASGEIALCSEDNVSPKMG